jgi:hypothetical protein
MSSPNDPDYSEAIVLCFAVFMVLLIIFWEELFEYIVYVWKYPTFAFFWIVSYLPDFINKILFFWADDVSVMAAETASFIISKPPIYFVDNINNYNLVNSKFGTLTSPYAIPLLLYGSWIVMNKKTFKKMHTIDTLIESESDLWPQIKPLVREHPEREGDLTKGKWAMASSPEEFAIKEDLFENFETDVGEKKFRMNEAKAHLAFKNQTGDPWTGLNNVTEQERQIFSIFITKIMRDTKGASKIINSLAILYTSEKLSFLQKRKNKKIANRLVESAIIKHQDENDVKKIINAHFYVKTVFAGLLEGARNDGVLASADFIWLKSRNRPLWYMLNNVGRKSAFSECAGPWSHFQAEKSVDRKLANPTITYAVEALDCYLYKFSSEYKPLLDEVEYEYDIPD